MLVTCFAGCRSDEVLKAIARVAPIPVTDPARIEKRQRSNGNPHWAIWQSAIHIEGTLAERYLTKSRGLSGPFNTLRFHPRCPRGAGKAVRFEPALIVGMHHGDRLTAIQRIFLDPDTAHYTAKIVLGRSIGAAWTNGHVAETIGIAEGFETAAAYTQLKGIPAWSSMGARRLPQLWLPPQVRTIILLRDNDPEGMAAERKAADAYRALGLVIEHDPPPTHVNDWAELLQP